MSDDTQSQIPPSAASADGLLDAWVTEVGAALGIPDFADALDIASVLDLARDAAHGVARPAAPLTTFLVGYAAAAQGASPERLHELLSIASQLATTYGSVGEK